MGIFNWFKKLSGKKPKKELVIEKMNIDEPIKAYSDDSIKEKEFDEIKERAVDRLSTHVEKTQMPEKRERLFPETPKATVEKPSTHSTLVKQQEQAKTTKNGNTEQNKATVEMPTTHSTQVEQQKEIEKPEIHEKNKPVEQKPRPVKHETKPVEYKQTVSPEGLRQLNKQLQKMEQKDKHQPPFVKKKEANFENLPKTTSKAIKQWEDTIKAAQQHPLSQVKILNSKILEDINSVLKTMDVKLNKLNDLNKLDTILELLKSTKEELEEKGVKSDNLDSAITEINQLTMKDKDVLTWVDRQQRVTAQQLGDFLNLSRSTASFRLNRLAELGALEKEAIGKKIYYKLKGKMGD